MAHTNDWQSLYVEIMREIKLRERVIDDLLFGDVKLGRAPKFELCFLELRMMCELLAISTLVAHGDIPATKSKRMRKAWEADRILRTMAQLRSDFFPIGMLPSKDLQGSITLIDNPQATFEQKDLIGLYRECGKVLHRGNLETLGNVDTSKPRFVKAGRWAKKIKALVTSHAIAGYGAEGLFLWWVAIDDDLTPHVLRLNRLSETAANGFANGSEKMG